MILTYLLEYSDDCSMRSESLYNYNRVEVNDGANEIFADRRLNNSKTTTSKSLEYKTKIKVRAAANTHVLNAKVVVSLKYLSKCWRFLDLTLINCEKELGLT